MHLQEISIFPHIIQMPLWHLTEFTVILKYHLMLNLYSILKLFPKMPFSICFVQIRSQRRPLHLDVPFNSLLINIDTLLPFLTLFCWTEQVNFSLNFQPSEFVQLFPHDRFPCISPVSILYIPCIYCKWEVIANVLIG